MRRLSWLLLLLALPALGAQTVTLTTQQKLVLTVPAQVVITSIEPRWQLNTCFDTEFIKAADGKSVTVMAGLTPCLDVVRLYVTGTVSGTPRQIVKNFWIEIVDEKASTLSVTVGNAQSK